MAKPASKTRPDGHDGTSGLLPGLIPIDRLLVDNGRSLEAMARMSNTLLDRLAAWQNETARFVAMRLEQDIAGQRDLAACRSPSEALEVCSAFSRKAMQDYLEEAGKVSGLAGDMTRACAAFGESLTAAAAPPEIEPTAAKPAASEPARTETAA